MCVGWGLCLDRVDVDRSSHQSQRLCAEGEEEVVVVCVCVGWGGEQRFTFLSGGRKRFWRLATHAKTRVLQVFSAMTLRCSTPPSRDPREIIHLHHAPTALQQTPPGHPPHPEKVVTLPYY